MEIVKDNEVLLDTQKFFAESAKDKLRNYPEKRELHSKRPNAKDYNDLLDFMDDMSRYQARKKQNKGHN